MYRQNTHLVELIEPAITAMGYEMLGIEQILKGNRSLVRIYIDKPEGVNLDDCESVSHQVTGIFDVNDPIKGTYDLEVSSPGFDRPLFKIEHFRRFIGNKARIYLLGKIDGRRKITGCINSVGDDSIEISEDGKSFIIQENLIDKARLVP